MYIIFLCEFISCISLNPYMVTLFILQIGYANKLIFSKTINLIFMFIFQFQVLIDMLIFAK